MDYGNLTDQEQAQLPDLLTQITSGSAEDEYLKQQLQQAAALRSHLMQQRNYGAGAGLMNGAANALAAYGQKKTTDRQMALMQEQARALRGLYGIDAASRQRAAQPVDPLSSGARLVFPSDDPTNREGGTYTEGY